MKRCSCHFDRELAENRLATPGVFPHTLRLCPGDPRGRRDSGPGGAEACGSEPGPKGGADTARAGSSHHRPREGPEGAQQPQHRQSPCGSHTAPEQEPAPKGSGARPAVCANAGHPGSQHRPCGTQLEAAMPEAPRSLPSAPAQAGKGQRIFHRPRSRSPPRLGRSGAGAAAAFNPCPGERQRTLGKTAPARGGGAEAPLGLGLRAPGPPEGPRPSGSSLARPAPQPRLGLGEPGQSGGSRAHRGRRGRRAGPGRARRRRASAGPAAPPAPPSCLPAPPLPARGAADGWGAARRRDGSAEGRPHRWGWDGPAEGGDRPHGGGAATVRKDRPSWREGGNREGGEGPAEGGAGTGEGGQALMDGERHRRGGDGAAEDPPGGHRGDQLRVLGVPTAVTFRDVPAGFPPAAAAAHSAPPPRPARYIAVPAGELRFYWFVSFDDLSHCRESPENVNGDSIDTCMLKSLYLQTLDSHCKKKTPKFLTAVRIHHTYHGGGCP